MQNKGLEKKAAKKVADLLEKNLVVKANTASCILWHEPKQPEALSRYQKE